MFESQLYSIRNEKTANSTRPAWTSTLTASVLRSVHSLSFHSPTTTLSHHPVLWLLCSSVKTLPTLNWSCSFQQRRKALEKRARGGHPTCPPRSCYVTVLHLCWPEAPKGNIKSRWRILTRLFLNFKLLWSPRAQTGLTWTSTSMDKALTVFVSLKQDW